MFSEFFFGISIQLMCLNCIYTLAFELNLLNSNEYANGVIQLNIISVLLSLIAVVQDETNIVQCIDYFTVKLMVCKFIFMSDGTRRD